MGNLNWFSGGDERSAQAIKLITELQNDTNSPILQNVLGKYKIELTEDQSSVPFILSRMNIELSQVLVENDIILSQDQTSKLNDLRDISNIRYGY